MTSQLQTVPDILLIKFIYGGDDVGWCWCIASNLVYVCTHVSSSPAKVMTSQLQTVPEM